MSPRVGLVLVHGFLSSAATWSQFLRLIARDRALTGLSVRTFQYRSPAVALHPLRRIPSLDDVADSLRTFLSVDLADCSRLVLVSHSQGGLVVQRLLAQALAHGEGRVLSRIRLVVMYACPHAGSDLALPLRRWAWFWPNRQERELRPLRATVTETQRIVLNRVVHDPDSRIKIMVYAGDSDGVVPPVSAKSVFPGAGTLPGDHFSIIQPDSHSHRSYTALTRDLLPVLTEPDAVAPAPRPRPALDRAELMSRPVLAPLPYERVVSELLAIPGMDEPSFRRQLYRSLPAPVREQLPRNSIARTELLGVTMTIEDYRHLGAWEALATGVRSLVPDHPAVDALLATFTELSLITARPQRER